MLPTDSLQSPGCCWIQSSMAGQWKQYLEGLVSLGVLQITTYLEPRFLFFILTQKWRDEFGIADWTPILTSMFRCPTGDHTFKLLEFWTFINPSHLYKSFPISSGITSLRKASRIILPIKLNIFQGLCVVPHICLSAIYSKLCSH